MATIKILGIDPGKSNTGYTIANYDTDKDKITVTDVGVFKAGSIVNKKEFREEVDQYGNLISIFVYEQEVKKLLEQFKPDKVVSEDAFYNPRMPLAYVSLKLCIHALERTCYQYGIPVVLIAPKLIKQVTWGKGTAKKDDIIGAVKKLPNLNISLPREYNEHEADSIAVTYSYVNLYLKALATDTKK